jgi:hypothetical protein
MLVPIKWLVALAVAIVSLFAGPEKPKPGSAPAPQSAMRLPASPVAGTVLVPGAEGGSRVSVSAARGFAAAPRFAQMRAVRPAQVHRLPL